ncbi:MAG: NAD-dependent epimerase/dehydratase family protein [Oligoflexia bacterium]|nr:NAD-dependent epimerase/dehydratase family protein [Oligoflexia bacterium]
MKTILVTGGAGHVGSHIIEQLVKNPNNKVISLDNYFNGRIENHITGAEYREGHTKDIDKLIPETPDIIFHLGEYARIAPSFDDIEQVFDMNTVGTFAVIEFCKKRKVGKLVYAASSTKFATNGQERFANPYSFTKANNVDLINSYGEWCKKNSNPDFEFNYAICYFYNAFGPREKGDGKYGTLIAKYQDIYLNGGNFTVNKPGTQKRNFTYVGDLARGMILTAEKGHGNGYTLNNKKAYSIIEIAESFGGPIEYKDGYPGRQDSGDTSTQDKARTELGWETTVDILDYIKDFIAKHPRK